MYLQDVFSQQFQAFHTAIIDDCDRAAQPDRTDAMVLRLRNNALALTKMQFAMLGMAGTEPSAPEPEPEPDDDRWRAPEPAASKQQDPDHILAGDALSRFVSRPLGPDESAHDVWLDQLENDSPKRRRNSGIQGAGFRSPSG